MQTLADVERASIKSLTPNARNARTHSPKQIRQIANSIEAFGFVNPVLVDEAGIILAGHGRVAAAKRLGIDEVPIVRIGHLSQAQRRAYGIADNQLALEAGWDDEILAIEFQALADLDFDLSLTGFDMGDIDRIIADIGGTSPPDAPLSPEDGPALTRPGDLWRIGPHRLICADALRAETYTRLMQGDEAELVFTDPPCNVPINGHVSGLGKQNHREFAMASGEMTPDAFRGFLGSVYGRLRNASCNGAIHFICMDWRHAETLLAAAEPVYSELKKSAYG
ncbi:MAG: ParB/Srx family N-terminal domain-containing protein [Pseudomonadota bacterium]